MNARDLAERLNLDHYAHSWRGPCPCCGYPRAFSLRAGKNDSAVAFCANGCDRDALADTLRRVAGGDALPQRHDDESDVRAAKERKQAAAARLWSGSTPAAGTIVQTYLTSRGLPALAASLALRFRADCPHPEGGRLPAMIVQVVDMAGKPIAVHRTYLRRDGGGKADVEPAKASLGPIWGGAICLHGVAPELVIGEGIETSASAGLLLSLPAWAAISAGNLARGLALPLEVRAVVIAADADPPGEAAARQAALRWGAEGRRVRIARPDHAGTDFNDLIRKARRG
jgi:putative DNA primase/helicase